MIVCENQTNWTYNPMFLEEKIELTGQILTTLIRSKCLNMFI